MLDRVMRRKRGLNHDASGTLSPSRPPRDLREKVERLLRGAEVGITEDGISAEDGGESDVREVMPFAQHLRADQRLGLAAAKTLEDPNQRALLARRIPIEHVHGDLREIAAEALLHLLRAEADGLQDFAAAQRTLRRDRPAQAAVVADEKDGAAMDSHRHAAVTAAEVMAALPAQEIRSISAAIDQDNGLLACRERLLQCAFQRRAEDDKAAIFFFVALAAQVNHLGGRKGTRFAALRQAW